MMTRASTPHAACGLAVQRMRSRTQIPSTKSSFSVSRRRASSTRSPATPVRAVSEPSSSTPFTASSSHLENWSPSSWRDYTALQQPNYPDEAALRAAVAEIERMPPLVFAGETRTLQDRLAAAARGEAFLMQGGDCAESFEQFSTNKVRDLYRLLLQMGVVVQYGGGVPVVKIARLAGTCSVGVGWRCRDALGAARGVLSLSFSRSLVLSFSRSHSAVCIRLCFRSVCEAAFCGYGEGWGCGAAVVSWGYH